MGLLKSLYMDMKGSIAMLMPTDLAGELGFLTDQEVQIKRNIDLCNSLVPDLIDHSYPGSVCEIDGLFILIQYQIKLYNGFYKGYFSERFKELMQRDREALGLD